MHDFIIWLMQLGASLPREKLQQIVGVEPLVDEMPHA
jgi:hypothetical protein